MKYLEKSLSVYPLVKRKPAKKEGRTTYHFCTECKKVHEVGKHNSDKLTTC